MRAILKRFPLIPSLIVLLAVAVMLNLGCWQWGRAAAKAQRLQARALAAATAPVPLNAQLPLPVPGAGQPVLFSGHYLPGQSLWLDNQSQQQQPGAHAWAVFALADGSPVLIDRGWMPLLAGALPPLPTLPSGPQQLRGSYTHLPSVGSTWGMQPADLCALKALPHSVNFPSQAGLHCLFGPRLLPGLVQLAPEAGSGFIRQFASAADTMPPARHRGYAAQWWAFAATLTAAYLFLILRKS